jgi:hypothetical protein
VPGGCERTGLASRINFHDPTSFALMAIDTLTEADMSVIDTLDAIETVQAEAVSELVLEAPAVDGETFELVMANVDDDMVEKAVLAVAKTIEPGVTASRQERPTSRCLTAVQLRSWVVSWLTRFDIPRSDDQTSPVAPSNHIMAARSNAAANSERPHSLFSLRALLICEERQEYFALFADQAEESPARILFALLQISVADDDGPNGRVFNFRVRLRYGHPVHIKSDIFYRGISFTKSDQAGCPTCFQLRICALSERRMDRHPECQRRYGSQTKGSKFAHEQFSGLMLLNVPRARVRAR